METKPTIETVLERLSAMESQIMGCFHALKAQVEAHLGALETQASSLRALPDILVMQVNILEMQVSGFLEYLYALREQKEGSQEAYKILDDMTHRLETMKQEIMNMLNSVRGFEHSISGVLKSPQSPESSQSPESPSYQRLRSPGLDR